MRYKVLIDCEGVEFKSGEIFKLACCDCGLVHRVALVSSGKKIGLAMQRDKRATAAKRRKR